MFAVNLIRLSFLKSQAKVLCNYRRSIMMKKRSRFGDVLLGVETHHNWGKIQKSKLTPKGFEIIYLAPVFQFLKYFYAALPLIWGMACFDFYKFIKDENYIKKLQDTIPKFTVKDKILQIVGMTVLMSGIQIFVSRTVVAIFRRENEFQSLMYGILGPLTKTYVPHGLQAVEQTSKMSVYKLKGKNVILWSSGFRNFKDFDAVVKFKSM